MDLHLVLLAISSLWMDVFFFATDDLCVAMNVCWLDCCCCFGGWFCSMFARSLIAAIWLFNVCRRVFFGADGWCSCSCCDRCVLDVNGACCVGFVVVVVSKGLFKNWIVRVLADMDWLKIKLFLFLIKLTMNFNVNLGGGMGGRMVEARMSVSKFYCQRIS